MLICQPTGGVLNKNFSLEECLLKIKKAGFDAADFSMDYDYVHQNPLYNEGNWREEARRIRAFAEEHEIPILQAHAWFGAPHAGETVENLMIPNALHDIEFAALAGATRIVVHPVQHFQKYYGFPYKHHEDEAFEINMGFYAALAPLAKDCGIRVCLENMYDIDPNTRYITHSVCSRAEEFNRYIDALEARFPGVFTACLDLGHVTLVGGELPEFIHAMGSRIGALHVHDTDYIRDLHTLPGQGKGAVLPAFEALHEVGYAGYFTLEANSFLRYQAPALFDDALAYMARVSRYYADIAENGTN